MILILNCGSQSIKWKLFDKNLNIKEKGKEQVFLSMRYKGLLFKILKELKDKEIDVIGHRVVHGGDEYRKPVRINNNVLREIKRFSQFAPLHNPYNLLGIKVAKKIFPKIRQIAVFDTEFFIDLPEKASIYPLPRKITKKYNFKKFGFHGISHQYASIEASKKIKKPFNKLNIISCHLGGGASISAIKNGKAIDTSMGFTPMEGLMMMTRAGDIDPGIVVKLNQNIYFKKVNKILNSRSGFKGMLGLSNMKEIVKSSTKSKKTKLALDMYIYRIQKYIGSYFAILGGCDLLVFTGAIGWEDGKKRIKNMILKDLHFLNKSKVVAIEPNEELAIAQKIKNI
ncbi:MAG: acetate/propionate family kinase [Candidatus Nealsonbacteria bacterium]